MSIDNFKTTLSLQQSQKYNVRELRNKNPLSELRPMRFEQSEGQRPSEYFAPAKYLPVSFMDKTTEDWVVIPKGRIVSAVPVSGNSLYIGEGVKGTSSADGEPTITTEVLQANIDNSYFGYDIHINNVLVPANGGNEATLYYTSDDVTAETIKSDGEYAAPEDTFTNAANIPLGVVYHDWYQDIRGKYLNYKMHPDGGHVLCDFFIEVPYIRAYDIPTSEQYASPAYTGSDAVDPNRQINNIFSYLVINETDVVQPGVFVQPDLIGNYRIQGGADSLTQSKNVQTVGKLIALDNRWPKDMLEEVMQYPGTGVQGITTAGLPRYLFDFIYANMLIKNGTKPTIEDVYNEAKSGANFGIARIQLLVS